MIEKLSAEIKSVVFTGQGYYAIVELRQNYLEDAFRILGDFRMALSKEAAMELIDTKYLEVYVASDEQKSKS